MDEPPLSRAICSGRYDHFSLNRTIRCAKIKATPQQFSGVGGQRPAKADHAVSGYETIGFAKSTSNRCRGCKPLKTANFSLIGGLATGPCPLANYRPCFFDRVSLRTQPVFRYPCLSSRYFSAAKAAVAPSPTAVAICFRKLFRASPAAKTPSIDVLHELSVTI